MSIFWQLNIHKYTTRTYPTMSANENLLIDLSNTSATEPSMNENASEREQSDSNSLMRSSVPIYKLWNSDDMGTMDSSENNPFDQMDKEAGLFNDPFEIVLNAARSSSNIEPNGSQADVETGTLISIDSPTESDRDRKVFFSSKMDSIDFSASMQLNGQSSVGDLFNVSPISSRRDASGLSSTMSFNSGVISISSDDSCSQSNINNRAFIKSEHSPVKNMPINNCLGSNILNNNSVPNSKCIYSNSNTSPSPPGAQSGGGRSSGRTKSNSLNLLKYSLTNSRGDTLTDGSPTITSGESSPTSPMSMKFNHLSKQMRQSEIDDSSDDLSATKPNWIDSETDIDLDSDADSDIENLNIPMLNRSLNELELGSGGNAGRIDDQSKKIGTPGNATNTNRDELLKKFESIKHKIPSPPTPIIKEEKGAEMHSHAISIPKQLVEENEPRTPPSQYSAVLETVQAKAFMRSSDENAQGQKAIQQPDNANLLIQNLKKFVEQCDDKVKQQEATNLLKSLSSILDSENSQQKNHLETLQQTPPQPIKRQGTFSIDKNDADEDDVSPSTESQHDVFKRPVVPPELNPGLNHVLKELQQVLGNQSVNVLQTNFSAINAGQSATNNNPTYIVVMGTPTPDELLKIHETPDMVSRTFRSQSLSAKDRPMAAVRAAQIKAELQKQENAKANIFQTPKRSSISRRSSFGASVTKENTIKPASSVPNHRRSIQLPSVSTPLSKSRLSSSLASMASPSPALTRRRSLLSHSGSAKDSPQKVKSLKPSFGTIMKPPPPPAARNLKIRVKESLGGRSTAPLKAMIPMNRANPLLMINESVSPIAKPSRKSLITSTPKEPSTVQGEPQFTRNMRTIRGNYSELFDGFLF